MKNTEPKIIIRQDVYDEIMYYVKNSTIEVSGMGKVITNPDGTIEVVSAYLPKQEGSAAETDLDDDTIASLMYESRNDEGELLWWWHSHVKMKVFMSSTDETTIEQLGKRGCMYATVFNHSAEMYSAYYQGGNGAMPPVYLTDLSTEVDKIPLVPNPFWVDNLKEKVTKAVYKPKRYPSANEYYQGGQGGELQWVFDPLLDDWVWYNSIGVPIYDKKQKKAIKQWAKAGKTKNDIPSPEERAIANRKRLDDARERRRVTMEGNGKGNFLPDVSSAKTSLLGSDDLNEASFGSLLDQYIDSPEEYSRWVKAWSKQHDKPEDDVSMASLWIYYEQFDGKVDDAEMNILNEMAMQEITKRGNA